MTKPEIRLLKADGEFRKCEEIQRSVWGGLSVSAEVMLVTQKAGGAVLGAFAKGKLAGFIYALLARRDGRIIHWSHMMGVLPAYRSQGFGLQLKLAHRRLALTQGIKSICWTFDPLQSRNATLNLAKLGSRVEEYVVDYYGRFPSSIERGLPSDRFVVNWPVASKAVEHCLAGRKPQSPIPDCPAINLTTSNDDGFLVNRKIGLNHREPELLLEVPPNTDRMRTEDLALARRWRLQTRRILLHYLSEGYRVREFHVEGPDGAHPRCCYVLRRGQS